MKYYIVSDIHGFYTILEATLRKNGFFDDTEPHKLIVCGDMFDRGNEVLEMQEFMLDLLHKDELIFIRGNHEDLLLEMLQNLEDYKWDIVNGSSHHCSNGTWATALALCQMSEDEALCSPEQFTEKVMQSPFCKELIPSSVDFFETSNYIFVHGWIPCFTEDMPSWWQRNRTYTLNPNWRECDKKDWSRARWFNGMELAGKHGILEPNKQIICGHWHTSWGHCYLENKCTEFGSDVDLTPYYGEGIIAIDGCVAHSGTINCLVLED